MKKISIALLALVTAGLAASCQKEETVEQGFTPMTINAVSEGIGAATKTEMAYKYDILWSENDRIYVTDGTSNDTFTLSDGEGTTKGTFKQDGDVTFTGEVQAYYPATMLDGGSPVWPASQTNDQTIPMYCKKTLSGAAEERMDFSSLGSVLQIVFNTTQENVTLKSIEIKDGSATLSGAFTVDTDGKAVITATDKAGITLDLGTGVALGKAANYFNIAVPAGNYQDLTLVFTATDGTKCTMTKGKVNIACNTVGRLTLTGETFKPDVPEGALAGVFSVSGTKKVHFSQGNLVATIDAAGTPTAWKFAANQYDCLGEGGANKTIGTAAGDVDLFGWSTASTTYGISTSTNNADYSGNFVDWGKTIGNGSTWRTLSNDEWVYLFETRTNASSLYKYGVTVCGKTNCVIIAPDNWDTSANPLQTSYDATAWATAEAAGLVCLPAAGRRDGSSVSDVGDSGSYWSSTAYDGYDAYFVYFNRDVAGPNSYDHRSSGYSVRLITECQ
ncbi:MAG: hypothetical protein MJY91_05580 [Bacteroidales bacterium]|nr:hypothetical protein [Bacteroidales bacterium]